MIPPPIVNSIYAPASEKKERTSQSPELTQTTWHRRRQRQIEADLQLLLDAQADGLIAGLEKSPPGKEGVLLENNMLSVRSLHISSGSFSSNDPPKKMDLLQARRGLYVKIRQLAILKAEEKAGFDDEVEQCVGTVEQLKAWDQRRILLHDRTIKLQEGQHQQKANEIRQTADRMQQEIDEMEASLAEMKRQQKQLRKNADVVENSLQAMMSTHVRDLLKLEKEIKSFSLDSGTSEPDTTHDTRNINHFWMNSAEQKTLEQALDVWQEKQTVVLDRQAQMQTETEALEEGAVVWKDVVKEVTRFEKDLREDMSSVESLKDGDPGSEADHAQDHMRNILAKMEQVIVSVDSKFKLAGARNWKLLIAAIAAELDAFKKGKHVLEAALDMNAPGLFEDRDGEGEVQPVASSITTARGAEATDQGEEIRGLDNAFEANQPRRHTSDTDTEDDGPDPNLLLSQQDTDTDE